MKSNKILLVTGASSDVGSLLIERIAVQYDKILAHYCNSIYMIDKLCSKYDDKIIPIKADFCNLNSTQKMIDFIKDKELCPDHIVHLPAQKARNLQFHKIEWDNYQHEIDISFRSITMIAQQLIPYMTKQKYGKIVFMLTAYLMGIPPKFLCPYITVKYALLGLMKALAVEYAQKNIMVNAVSPDMMQTKFLSDLPELVKEQSAKNNPLGRNLYIEEIVPTIMYLLSDGADVITGQNIGITVGGR